MPLPLSQALVGRETDDLSSNLLVKCQITLKPDNINLQVKGTFVKFLHSSYAVELEVV